MKKRKNMRFPGYDYSLPGNYFVTICTKNREPWFGEIVDGKMILNEVGKVVQRQWYWLEKQYGHCVRLDQFVIMPDHVHGIIFINDPIVFVGTGFDRSVSGPENSEGLGPPLHRERKMSLPKIVGAFKTTSSKMIRKNQHSNFAWQRSYHDRIIRNETQLQRIRHYIFHNPDKH